MLTRLVRAVEQGEIKCGVAQVLSELKSYQWDDAGIVQDSVMALAIACHDAGRPRWILDGGDPDDESEGFLIEQDRRRKEAAAVARMMGEDAEAAEQRELERVEREEDEERERRIAERTAALAQAGAALFGRSDEDGR